MRLSISGSSYAALSVACAVLLSAIPYGQWIVYAPPVTDRFASVTRPDEDEYFASIDEDTTLLLRVECLATNVVQMKYLGMPDAAMIPESYIFATARYLENTPAPPKRIVVLEDGFLYLFMKQKDKMAQNSPDLREPATEQNEKEEPVSASFAGYLNALPYRNARDHDTFREQMRGQPPLWRDPALLRDFLSQWIGRITQSILPTRQTYDQTPAAWLYHQWTAWRTGDPRERLAAFEPYAGIFFLSLLQQELISGYFPREKLEALHAMQERIIEETFPYDQIENSAVPPGYSMLGGIYADGMPQTAAEENEYPLLRALLRAQEKGSEITVILLPSNPNFERAVADEMEPYYNAMQNVCERHGWRFHDGRTIKTPALEALPNYLDHMHTITARHPRFFKAVAAMIREAIEK